MKKKLSLFLFAPLCLALCLFAMNARPASAATVTINGSTVTLSGGDNKNSPAVLDSGNATGYITIDLAGSENYFVKLKGVTLPASGNPALKITNSGGGGNCNLFLLLEGTNTLTGGSGKNGVEVGAGVTLTIMGSTGGMLYANGAGSADGIKAGSDIIVESGKVYAYAGSSGGVGICTASPGTITINGGTVAGIAAGANNYGISCGGLLTISGGEVMTGNSLNGISGVGVTIEGGVVGVSGSTGIQGNTGDITIKGGTIESGATATDLEGNGVVIDGGSVLVTNASSIKNTPKNKKGAVVYCLTVTVPGANFGAAVSALTATPELSYYSFKDVQVKPEKIYLWLPADTYSAFELTVDGTVYSASGAVVVGTDNTSAVTLSAAKKNDPPNNATAEPAATPAPYVPDSTPRPDTEGLPMQRELSMDGGLVDGKPLDIASLKPGEKLPEPVKDGFLFAGWYTNSAFSGEPTFRVILGETAYYARWEKLSGAYIFYEANDGEDTSKGIPSRCMRNPDGTTTYTLSERNPKRDGYTFMGWCINPEGKGKCYQPGEEVTLSEPTMFYAIWKKK